MQHGYLDIPYAEMQKYQSEAKQKIGTCRVIPRGRFAITVVGIEYRGLICHMFDMGGEATGVGALSCRNCVLKELPGSARGFE